MTGNGTIITKSNKSKTNYYRNGFVALALPVCRLNYQCPENGEYNNFS